MDSSFQRGSSCVKVCHIFNAHSSQHLSRMPIVATHDGGGTFLESWTSTSGGELGVRGSRSVLQPYPTPNIPPAIWWRPF